MASQDGRNEQGKFTRGNRFGTGRKVSELRRAFFTVLSEADARALAKTVRDKALAGDVQALKIILPYVAGMPLDSEQIRTEIFRDEDPLADLNL